MAVTKTASKPKPASKTERKFARAAAKPADAIKLLKDDHKEVRDYFSQYEKLEDEAEKQALADRFAWRSPFMLRSKKRFTILPRATRSTTMIYWTMPKSSTLVQSG